MSQESMLPAEATEYVGDARRESTLADLFVTLADTLVADYDVVELLDGLVRACEPLFGVSAAGVLLFDAGGQLRLVASSSDRAEALEVFEVQADEGPLLDCARSMNPVLISELDAAAYVRWPRFCAAAEIVGVRAVHALPLRLRGEALGGFGLFHPQPATLSQRDVHTAQALADVVTIGILQQRHKNESVILTDQLQRALDSRVAIEQAKGILAEKGDLDMSAAFARLRRYARNHNLKISDLAAAIVNRHLPAAMVLNTGTSEDA